MMSNCGMGMQLNRGIALKTENHFFTQMRQFKMTKIIQRTMKIDQIMMKRTDMK